MIRLRPALRLRRRLPQVRSRRQIRLVPLNRLIPWSRLRRVIPRVRLIRLARLIPRGLFGLRGQLIPLVQLIPGVRLNLQDPPVR